MHPPTFASGSSLARAGLAGLIVVVAIAGSSDPGNSPWLPACIFHQVTGLYCPGCGSTRMLYALLHGQPLEALRDNALSLIALPIILYGLIHRSFNLRLPVVRNPPAPWLATVAIAVVLFTVARNIPAEPFSGLAPAEPALSAKEHN